jgi:hypothetical protein
MSYSLTFLFILPLIYNVFKMIKVEDKSVKKSYFLNIAFYILIIFYLLFMNFFYK